MAPGKGTGLTVPESVTLAVPFKGKLKVPRVIVLEKLLSQLNV